MERGATMQWLWRTNTHVFFVTIHDSDERTCLVTIDDVKWGMDGYYCRHYFDHEKIRVVSNLDIEDNAGRSFWLIHN
jgi:hypothetical protein